MSNARTRPHWTWFSGAFCLAWSVSVLSAGCRAQVEPDGPRRTVFRRHSHRLRGFDPVQAADVYSAKAVGLVYEGLLQYAYEDRPYSVRPSLAEAMPAVSADGLTYTFRLRDGVRFAADPCFGADAAGRPRGRALDAGDVVYALKRLADLKNASPGYWTLNERIVGLDEFRAASAGPRPTDYGRDVAGLQAPDARTLRITLKRPYPQLLSILTMSYTFPVAREAVAFYGTEFLNHPVGTGPYRLDCWRRNHRVEFARNPAWLRGPGDPRDALIDRIVFHVIDDPSTAWLMFLSGQLDLQAEISRDNWDAVITPDRELVETLRARGIVLSSIASLDTAYIAFNMDDPVVGTNRKLRQALTCAFNSEEWIRFYNYRVARARGPIPPGIAGHRETPSPFPFDLARASGLLAEAGYPGGKDPATGRRLQLTLDLGRTDLETRESTELLIEFMARIGVVVAPVYSNWPAFLAKLSRRQAQMFRIAWLADYPDAENFLQLFHGPNASPGPNRANYVNAEFDRLYEQVREMQDTPRRTALYRRMEDIVIEDCPWIFMCHRMDYNLAQPWLKGYHPHDFPYGMEKYYRVASRKQRAARDHREQ